MPWILKARKAETGYLSQSSESNLKFTQDANQAKTFECSQQAEQFAEELNRGDLSATWVSRKPELFPVRLVLDPSL